MAIRARRAVRFRRRRSRKYVRTWDCVCAPRGGVPRPHHRGGARRGARPRAGGAGRRPRRRSLDALRRRRRLRAIRAQLHVARPRGGGRGLAISRPLRERISTSESDASTSRCYDDTLPALERLREARVRASSSPTMLWALPDIIRTRIDAKITQNFAGAHEARVSATAATSRTLRRGIEACACPASPLSFAVDTTTEQGCARAPGSRHGAPCSLTVRAQRTTPTHVSALLPGGAVVCVDSDS